MKLFNIFKKDRLDEATEAFKNKNTIIDKKKKDREGEGYEFLPSQYGITAFSSLENFYRSSIDKQYEDEIGKIKMYRSMAEMPEIGDVLEDAVNESIVEFEDGGVLSFQITNNELEKNNNIVKNLNDEFYELFYNKIKINDILEDLVRTYYIDSRVFYEKIIDVRHPSNGIIGIRKLPTETMDYFYNEKGEIIAYCQYLDGKPRNRASNIKDLESDPRVIIFYPQQIGFVNYGIYGKTKYDIKGYLEKAKVPYNQLKLLETSVIIYRVIRAPERFVFRIDTGNMPIDKSHKFVEDVKKRLSKKISFDPKTGTLVNETDVMGIIENFYLPQSSGGRGSSVDSIGGNMQGFSELDDVKYFQKKLYRSLKYPMSRVESMHEGRSGDIVFGGSGGEISRDEIKWSIFLEKNQHKFINNFKKMFLLHLEFKGLKKQYNLTEADFDFVMGEPNAYKEKIRQGFNESRYNTYSSIADRKEISYYFAMKKYLNWTDDEIQENVAGFKKDKELLGITDEDSKW